MANLWSGRFSSEPDPTAFAFGSSFRFDRRLFEDDVVGSLAWVDGLAGAGVFNRAEAEKVSSALSDILDRGRRDSGFIEGPDEDVHAFVERQLVERVGDLGKRLHTGRSRNEQVSLDLRLYLRRRIPLLQGQLAGVIGALAKKAESAGDAVMPSYTHLRRAMPVLVAHFFLAHVSALRRDYERFNWASYEADAMPLGSGAVAGTNYAIDTATLASRLGFSKVVTNSIDASADRDFVAAFLYTSTTMMVHLSRLAEDLIIFCGEEHGFFQLSDASSTGSSMMPQKKNPDPLELIRGKAGRLIGHLTGWMATMKGLPSGYNKDLQEDKEAVFDAEDNVAGALASLVGVVDGLEIFPVKTAAAASGLLLATDVADFLVAKGMPFREAHEVVGGMVRELLAEGRDFSGLTLADWRRHSQLFDDSVRGVVTPEASVRARKTPQSTHPHAVEAALAEVNGWLRGVLAP
ncbi:MAG TPA: argininosuccinate lyase [Vicinamibacterales bacterium]|nr:argininosuccinate lyase [Vicinamibacterales bacterium]